MNSLNVLAVDNQDNHNHDEESSLIGPMAIPCGNCGIGTMILDDIEYGTWNVDSVYECWYVGCIITKDKRAVVKTYRCDYCNYAKDYLSYEYRERHSISH